MIGDGEPGDPLRKRKRAKRCAECGVRGCKSRCLDLERDPEAFGTLKVLGLNELQEGWAEQDD